jgi:hypothetical protein
MKGKQAEGESKEAPAATHIKLNNSKPAATKVVKMPKDWGMFLPSVFLPSYHPI